MANFRIWSGRWVKVLKTQKTDQHDVFEEICEGEKLQILNTPNLNLSAYTFVGKKGYYTQPSLAPAEE